MCINWHSCLLAYCLVDLQGCEIYAGAGAKSGGDVGDYEAKLKAALKEHQGSMSMATLGSAVKRPAAVPKLKKFLEEHAAFKLDEKGNVSLR